MFNERIDEIKRTLAWLNSQESWEVYHHLCERNEIELELELELSALLKAGYYGTEEAKYITA